jgi:hypothetical protein
MRKRFWQYWISIWTNILFSAVLFPSQAQQSEQYFKFPILESGVYRLNEEDVQSLGFSSLDDVSVFGNWGMLPQKLDSSIFSLNEIPIQKVGNSIFFFLEGPHQIKFDEGNFKYEHHLYSDSLFYLIGPKEKGNLIKENNGPPSNSSVSGDYYLVQTIKWENTNLLNSGRNWYSEPLNPSGSLNLPFEVSTGNIGNGIFQAKIMGQSLGTSTFRFLAEGTDLGEVQLAPIPNSIYGIKGREVLFSEELNNPGGNLTIRAEFQTGDANGRGFLDYALLACPYPANALSQGKIYHILDNAAISPTANEIIWKLSPNKEISLITNRTALTSGDRIAIFEPNSVPRITSFNSANLSARSEKINSPLIIISSQRFINQVNALAAHKNSLGSNTFVISPEEIYDAFGYGTRDVSAIRNFLAYHFHQSAQLKNVLFFGKGTYDYKAKLGGRPNLVPTYSSRSSLNPLTTFSSDDFFGFLELGKGEWTESPEGDETLDIGVGRIPAITTSEARTAIDKIIAYETPGNAPGNWKRNLAFLADDGDNNIHLNDAESHANHITEKFPAFNIEKLYLDRFDQLRVNGIQSSPAAREALKESLDEGLLFLNYIGHGNETTLTAERVFSVSDLPDFPDNPYLPLFVTATCEFGRQDSPFIRSGAEELLFVNNKGAIGLLTTGRPVFSSVNFRLNRAFIESVFVKENGEIKDLGSIFKDTKNNSLNGAFNRNFSLIGDPSLKLAIPDLDSEIEKIKKVDLDLAIDTLKAQQALLVKGKITDPSTGAVMSSYRGEYEISIYDKPLKVKTLGDESSPVEFSEQTALIFKGKGEVVEGGVEAEVFIPTNIDYSLGTGSIKLFATLQNGQEEAMGAKNIPIGGSSDMEINDMIGPEIRMFFGDEFKENPGPLNSPNVPLKILFNDESGINISSAAIGQDIELFVNNLKTATLNPQFVALESSYKKGQVVTLLRNLQEGTNTITLRAWDNVGNSSTFETELEIRGSLQIKILESKTYPNPTNYKSKFRVRHNRSGENLQLGLRIYSIMGSEIYSFSKRYVEAEAVLDDLEWIFFHKQTNYPIKGTYIYELTLESEKDGTSDHKSGKIIIQ